MSKKQTTMRDRMIAFLGEKMREKLGESVFVNMSYYKRNSLTDQTIRDLKREMQESKTKVQIEDIIPIKNDLVNFVEVGREVRPIQRGKKGIEPPKSASTGIYEIRFNNGDVMILGSWFDFQGNIETIFGGTEQAWKNFYYQQAQHVARQQKPKMGIWNIRQVQHVLYYDKASWTFKGNVIHPKIKVIENEVDTFFNNISQFSMYGQVPFRKIITIGPPGTGKSSINFHLANKLKDKYSIIFSQDMNDIAKHMALCAKYDVPTIVFYDDAEGILSGGDSGFLNFLSGSNTPNMKKGCMIIFTSNMTVYIEDRTLRRPGRIDRIISIDPLMGKDLFECAKMYFKDIDWSEKAEEEWISLFQVIEKDVNRKPTGNQVGMTGAEMQGLAQLCYVEANSNQRKIDYEFIKEVKKMMEDNLQEAYNMMQASSMVSRPKWNTASQKNIGFKISEERF